MRNSYLEEINFRFEKLNIPRLNIEQKYATIFQQYGTEVEEMRKVQGRDDFFFSFFEVVSDFHCIFFLYFIELFYLFIDMQ